MSLTKLERETLIMLNDGEEWAEIWTAQRPRITQLKARGAALIEEGRVDDTAFAKFRLPARCISFRTVR